MLKNQKGNTLITVMLVSLVLTTLGLTIMASTIGSTKRVEIRESDIEKTYEGKQVVDNMISALSIQLQSIPLDGYDKNNIDSMFDFKLADLLQKELIDKNKTKPFVECLNIVDLNGDKAKFVDQSSTGERCVNLTDDKYKAESIDTNKDFTRVYEIVLVTKNPNATEGQFKRIIRKKVILSPLPSFLKYAVGSCHSDSTGGLYLNGSPNIVGNVYGNILNLKGEAEFIDQYDNKKIMNAPLPSIHGDLYSSESTMLNILKKENFYRGKVPKLKNDSQFINIKFAETFVEQAREGLKQSVNASYSNSLSKSIISHINGQVNKMLESQLTQPWGTDNHFELVSNQDSPLVTTNEEALYESYKLESKNEPLTLSYENYVPKDLVINSLNQSITLNGDLFVKGDLYIVANKDVTINANLYATGSIYLIGFNGRLQIGSKSNPVSIYANHDISITTESNNPHHEFYANILAADSFKVTNKRADLTFHQPVLTGSKVVLTSSNSANIQFSDDILAGDDVDLTSKSNTVVCLGDILTEGTFRLSGDGNDSLKEDDIFQFNSVVYALDQGFVSNVSIVGANENEDQLVLMTKGKLTITRINEFENFDESKETDNQTLPSEDETIQPLKAFFYTDEEAELYGVGSLFYINGGIFAKDKLVINSVRGEVKRASDLDGVLNFQQDYLSRFNVVYNKKVLLGRINSLPIVEYLQVIPDDLIIE